MIPILVIIALSSTLGYLIFWYPSQSCPKSFLKTCNNEIIKIIYQGDNNFKLRLKCKRCGIQRTKEYLSGFNLRFWYNIPFETIKKTIKGE